MTQGKLYRRFNDKYKYYNKKQKRGRLYWLCNSVVLRFFNQPEIIIVDNNSTDDSMDIVQNFKIVQK